MLKANKTTSTNTLSNKKLRIFPRQNTKGIIYSPVFHFRGIPASNKRTKLRPLTLKNIPPRISQKRNMCAGNARFN